jgi:hypothetical protein
MGLPLVPSRILDALVGGDHERFTFGRKLSSPPQEFDANGAVHFSVREDLGCHYDEGAIVDFIENSVFNSLGFHNVDLLTFNNVMLLQTSQKVIGHVCVSAFEAGYQKNREFAWSKREMTHNAYKL